MNDITMKLQADNLIRLALQEDITSEDVSTNAVMPTVQMGEVELIAKEDGVIAGLDVYARVFELLDEKTVVTFLLQRWRCCNMWATDGHCTWRYPCTAFR